MSKADFKLISVPPSTPIIRSEHGKLLDKVSEPVQEGSTLTLICETQGGEPLPRLTWKRGQSVLGTHSQITLTNSQISKIYILGLVGKFLVVEGGEPLARPGKGVRSS
jgi:hypothetical protein